jgi:sec-independent protein translocase protein TatA
MGIGPIGPFEAIIILLVVVLIFGVNKVGDLGGALGKSVREFRRAAKEDEPGSTSSASATSNGAITAPPQTEGLFCSNCGAGLDNEAKFCAKCGAPTKATVS